MDVRITDDVIFRLTKNARFVQAFPLFKSPPLIAQRRKGCGGCRRRREKRGRFINYDAMRQAIAQFNPEQQRQLKELLGATSVQLRWRGHGRVENRSF